MALLATGAGDAFAAGFVSEALLRNGLGTLKAFERAAQTGTALGAYACMYDGGANLCPSSSEIKDFCDTHMEVRRIEHLAFSDAVNRLREYDLIFRDPNRR